MTSTSSSSYNNAISLLNQQQVQINIESIPDRKLLAFPKPGTVYIITDYSSGGFYSTGKSIIRCVQYSRKSEKGLGKRISFEQEQYQGFNFTCGGTKYCPNCAIEFSTSTHIGICVSCSTSEKTVALEKRSCVVRFYLYVSVTTGSKKVLLVTSNDEHSHSHLCNTLDSVVKKHIASEIQRDPSLTAKKFQLGKSTSIISNWHQSAIQISKIEREVHKSKSLLVGGSSSVSGLITKIQLVEQKVHNSIIQDEKTAGILPTDSILPYSFPYLQNYILSNNEEMSYILLGAPSLIKLQAFIQEFDVDVTHNVFRFADQDIHQFSTATLIPTVGAVTLVRIFIWKQSAISFQNMFQQINNMLQQYGLDWLWSSSGFNSAYLNSVNAEASVTKNRFTKLMNDQDNLVEEETTATLCSPVETVRYDFHDGCLKGLELFLKSKFGAEQGKAVFDYTTNLGGCLVHFCRSLTKVAKIATNTEVEALLLKERVHSILCLTSVESAIKGLDDLVVVFPKVQTWAKYWQNERRLNSLLNIQGKNIPLGTTNTIKATHSSLDRKRGVWIVEDMILQDINSLRKLMSVVQGKLIRDPKFGVFNLLFFR